MNNGLYEAKLKVIRSLVVPSLFTDRQFNVLLKRVKGGKLSQTEKNYLSNAIKSKINAIISIKHLDLHQLYESRKSAALKDSIILSYSRSKIDLITFRPLSGKSLPPTKVIEEVLDNYQSIDVRIADLLPVYICRNKNKIDLFEIYSFAIEKGLINFTGYIFDIAYFFSYHKEFKRLIKSLERNKDKFNIIRDDKYKNIINLIKQDDLSRKWNIYTFNKLDDYRNYFELYGEEYARA